MNNNVVITPCKDYDPENIKQSLVDCLAPLGGLSAFVKPSDTVVLKVNLLMKATPDKCITTNPEIVRQVGYLCKEIGVKEIIIADSPGGKDTTPTFAARAFAEAGFSEVATELGATCEFLSNNITTVYNENNKLYKSLPIGSRVLGNNVVINLPKCKTHGLMKFTGAVKNLFGTIPGVEKAAFHAKVPDSFDFADLLIDIYDTVSPTLNIMDAVIGMEGEGPSGGSPKQIGAILASTNAFHLDAIAEAIIGFTYGETYITQQAIDRKLLPKDFNDIKVIGNWNNFVVNTYKHANDINMGKFLPKGIQKVVRKHLVASPVLIEKRDQCVKCKICLENCPVDAITMSDKDGKPEFELGKCIRCYCCQELCPKHLIDLKEPMLNKYLKFDK